MSNKYLGHTGGLIGPVPESVIESKPDFRDYDQGGQYHNAYTNWFNEHLSSLPVIPCEGWVPEIGREYTEGMDVSIKWHVKTQSYQGETDHYFDTEKEADKKYSEWSKWDGNLMALTSKPVKVAVQYVAIPLTPASPTEQAEGGEDFPGWAKPENEVIDVPDYLDKLINKIGFQVRLHTISERFGEAEMVCRIARVAELFFKQSQPPVREGYQADPPSDFTLWVVVNKWQYDHVQHKWYNTFVEQMKGKVFSHAELFTEWKRIQSQSK